MRVLGKLRVAWLAAFVVGVACIAPAAADALTVTKTADTDDGDCAALDCSLREAIEDTPEGGIVVLPASATPYQVTDGEGSLVINKDLTIAGAGARATEVTAPGATQRVFSVKAVGLSVLNVTVRDLSITGGDGGGAGYGGMGGGILAVNESGITGPELTLERVRVAGNKASVSGLSGIAVGGGVDADGAGTKLIVRDSLITGNQAIGTNEASAGGGGIGTWAGAQATVENTTIVGNQAIGQRSTDAAARGGGMLAFNGTALTNVTIFGNGTSRSDPGAAPSTAGNLETDGTAQLLRNTLIGGGSAEAEGFGDCRNAFTSLGGNVLPAGCGAPLATDRVSALPLLAPLADNGGPTDTMALLTGSPALDAGVGCPPPSADQRGVARPQGPACDSGAFELEVLIEPPPPPDAVFYCHGKKATITGTNAKETLLGTKRADVIFARGGNDTIKARAGNDVVCGGPGKDLVRAGAGNDSVYGEKGPDTLRGGPGRDTIVGGPGKDTLRGGPGKDVER